MTEPVKYLKIVSDLISLYQRELLRLFKKYPQDESAEFNKIFSTIMVRLKDTQISKGIDQGISLQCQRMAEHLKGGKAPPIEQRYNKTSYQPRRQLKSQVGTRLMGLTGGLRRSQERNHPIREESEISDIIQSYKIEEELVPRMRMKWRSAYEPNSIAEAKDISTIGNNNIHLLSYAIPQIENSIRRLSHQRSPKSPKERELEAYKTVDSKIARKKYVQRLL